MTGLMTHQTGSGPSTPTPELPLRPKPWILTLGGTIGLVGALLGFHCCRVRPIPEDLLREIRARVAASNQPALKRRHWVIIDYRLPISARRLWLYDPETGNVRLNTHVGHAWASGLLLPGRTSNRAGSLLTCCGLFITDEVYKGGTRVRLKGLDPGVNDNAMSRGIVFHAGNLPWEPWSQGCFTTWPSANRMIVEIAREGALVYVKGPDPREEEE